MKKKRKWPCSWRAVCLTHPHPCHNHCWWLAPSCHWSMLPLQLPQTGTAITEQSTYTQVNHTIMSLIHASTPRQVLLSQNRAVTHRSTSPSCHQSMHPHQDRYCSQRTGQLHTGQPHYHVTNPCIHTKTATVVTEQGSYTQVNLTFMSPVYASISRQVL